MACDNDCSFAVSVNAIRPTRERIYYYTRLLCEQDSITWCSAASPSLTGGSRSYQHSAVYSVELINCVSSAKRCTYYGVHFYNQRLRIWKFIYLKCSGIKLREYLTYRGHFICFCCRALLLFSV